MATKEEIKQALEDAKTAFRTAVYGKDVRQALVDVEEAVYDAIDQWGTIVDKTLTGDGAAADAKAVGDLFGAVSSTPPLSWNLGGYVNSSGRVVTTDGQSRRSAYTDIMPVTAGEMIKNNNPSSDDAGGIESYITAYNGNTFVQRVSDKTAYYVIPDNVDGVRLSVSTRNDPLTMEKLLAFVNYDLKTASVSKIEWDSQFKGMENILPQPEVTWLTGFYIAVETSEGHEQGQVYNDGGYATRSAVSNIIQVRGGDTIQINTPSTYVNDNQTQELFQRAVFYKGGNYDSQRRCNVDGSRTIVIPEGVTEIRFSLTAAPAGYVITRTFINNTVSMKFWLKPATSADVSAGLLSSMIQSGGSNSVIIPANYMELGWGYGYIDFENGTGVLDTLAQSPVVNNIVCPQYVYVRAGVTFESTDDYKFRVICYTEQTANRICTRKTYFDSSAYTVPNNYFVRIVMAKPDDSEITDIYDVVSHLVVKGTLYILHPSIQSRLIGTEVSRPAFKRFVKAMNEKAQQLGMTSSTFVDANGGNANNTVTPADMVRMMIEACSYDELCRIWGINEHTIRTYDAQRRVIQCRYGTAVDKHAENYYPLEIDYFNNTLEPAYHVYGKKNGFIEWSEGAFNSITMVAVCQLEDKVVVAALGGAKQRRFRPLAMKALLDNAARTLRGEPVLIPDTAEFKAMYYVEEETDEEGHPIQNGDAYFYHCGAVAELPAYPVLYERVEPNWIYQYYPNRHIRPASSAKVMNVMVMLDHVKDLSEKLTISNVADMGGGNPSDGLQDGDVLTFKQAMWLQMLPSNGYASNAVARVVGTKIMLNDYMTEEY